MAAYVARIGAFPTPHLRQVDRDLLAGAVRYSTRVPDFTETSQELGITYEEARQRWVKFTKDLIITQKVMDLKDWETKVHLLTFIMQFNTKTIEFDLVGDLLGCTRKPATQRWDRLRKIMMGTLKRASDIETPTPSQDKIMKNTFRDTTFQNYAKAIKGGHKTTNEAIFEDYGGPGAHQARDMSVGAVSLGRGNINAEDVRDISIHSFGSGFEHGDTQTGGKGGMQEYAGAVFFEIETGGTHTGGEGGMQEYAGAVFFEDETGGTHTGGEGGMQEYASAVFFEDETSGTHTGGEGGMQEYAGAVFFEDEIGGTQIGGEGCMSGYAGDVGLEVETGSTRAYEDEVAEEFNSKNQRVGFASLQEYFKEMEADNRRCFPRGYTPDLDIDDNDVNDF